MTAPRHTLLHITGLSEERLKHYNRVLAGQLDELRDQVELAQQRFCAEFGHAPWLTPKPAQLMGLAARANAGAALRQLPA